MYVRNLLGMVPMCQNRYIHDIRLLALVKVTLQDFGWSKLPSEIISLNISRYYCAGCILMSEI